MFIYRYSYLRDLYILFFFIYYFKEIKLTKSMMLLENYLKIEKFKNKMNMSLMILVKKNLFQLTIIIKNDT
jgi:hypothetical protein